MYSSVANIINNGGRTDGCENKKQKAKNKPIFKKTGANGSFFLNCHRVIRLKFFRFLTYLVLKINASKTYYHRRSFQTGNLVK